VQALFNFGVDVTSSMRTSSFRSCHCLAETGSGRERQVGVKGLDLREELPSSKAKKITLNLFGQLCQLTGCCDPNGESFWASLCQFSVINFQGLAKSHDVLGTKGPVQDRNAVVQ